MKAEIYLNTYEHLYRHAERLTDKIAELETLATSGGGAIRYDHDRVMCSPGRGVMSVVDQKVSLEKVRDDTIEEMIRIKEDLQEIFSHLVNQDKQIAEMLWFEFEGPTYISQQLHIGRVTVIRRRRMIIRYVQEVIDRDSVQ